MYSYFLQIFWNDFPAKKPAGRALKDEGVIFIFCIRDIPHTIFSHTKEHTGKISGNL
jgi:hypothetical protein